MRKSLWSAFKIIYAVATVFIAMVGWAIAESRSAMQAATEAKEASVSVRHQLEVQQARVETTLSSINISLNELKQSSKEQREMLEEVWRNK